MPLLHAAGHEIVAPRRSDLDLLSQRAVAEAVAGADALFHLATRIPVPERRREPKAWQENDQLRAVASRLLVDGALAGGAQVFVQPHGRLRLPDWPD